MTARKQPDVDLELWAEYIEYVKNANAKLWREHKELHAESSEAYERRLRDYEQLPWYRKIFTGKPAFPWRSPFYAMRPYQIGISIAGYYDWLLERQVKPKRRKS